MHKILTFLLGCSIAFQTHAGISCSLESNIPKIALENGQHIPGTINQHDSQNRNLVVLNPCYSDRESNKCPVYQTTCCLGMCCGGVVVTTGAIACWMAFIITTYAGV